MKKKLFLSALFLILAISFSFSYSFAAMNIVDSMRNVVGGAENVVEDAAQGIAGGVRSGMNTVQDAGQNIMDMDTNNSTFMGTMTDNNNGDNGDYAAQRTTTRAISTNDTTSNFIGNNSNLLAWLTMAILAVSIVTLVWYYGKQFNYSSTNNDDNY